MHILRITKRNKHNRIQFTLNYLQDQKKNQQKTLLFTTADLSSDNHKVSFHR